MQTGRFFGGRRVHANPVRQKGQEMSDVPRPRLGRWDNVFPAGPHGPGRNLYRVSAPE